MKLLVVACGVEKTLFVLSASKRRWRDVDRSDGRWQRFKAKLAKAYDGLKDRLPYYEKVCAELKGLRSLTLVHDDESDPSDVLARTERFLESRRRRHTRWFAVDLVLAALGAMLMPLPGPNLFFFYPAARAFGHYQARRGAEDALRRRPWETKSDRRANGLGQGLSKDPRRGEDVDALERAHGFEDLGKRLESLRMK